MSTDNTCSSCKKRIANDTSSVTFPCPGCGKQKIVRCKHCREIVAEYKCHECGHTGP